MPDVELFNHEELEEVKAKSFTKRVALVTALFAVVLAIASLGGNNATKEMLLAQQQSSDQWSFYQAKVIREHLYRGQKLRIEADLIERGPAMRPESRRHYEAFLKKMDEEASRYASEKREIEAKAKEFEHERDMNRNRDPYFDYAEVLLQISIVMSSISILASSRPVFYFACGLAFFGALLALNGYFLFLKLPFLH